MIVVRPFQGRLSARGGSEAKSLALHGGLNMVRAYRHTPLPKNVGTEQCSVPTKIVLYANRFLQIDA